MRKRLKAIIVGLLVLTMLAGCKPSASLEVEGEPGEKPDTLTVVIPVDIATLFQWDSEDSWAQNVWNHIYDPLWRISPIDGTLSGCIAEEWEMSTDFTECKVKIHEGVKFHNGDPLTTKDVKWTLEEAKEPAYLPAVDSEF